MIKIQARWYGKTSKERNPNCIVIHAMQAPLKGTTARSVGTFFSRLPASNKASAHVGIDCAEPIRYVEDKDIAYAAPGMNTRGLHAELAGYSEWAEGRWSDADVAAMFRIAAPIVREWCQQYDIPARFVTARQLKAGDRGITTHYEVSQAWKMSNHWDPGPRFPIQHFIDLVNQRTTLALVRPSTVIETAFLPEGEDMATGYKRVACPTGGYWLLKMDDGGVGSYSNDGRTSGDGVAPFFGSAVREHLAAPAVDLTPCVVSGRTIGYWITTRDGAVYAYGEAPFLGGYNGHIEWHGGGRYIMGLVQTAENPISYRLIGREPTDAPFDVDAYQFPI